MHPETWQLILIVLLSACTILDSLTLAIGLNFPAVSGTLAGLIMGNMPLGLAIGATLQLMVLGVGTYGGASVPDFATGAIVSTVLAALSGQKSEFAIGLAVPVGLLMVQLDVLARFANTWFVHRVDRFIAQNNIAAVERNILYGALPWIISRALPVFIMLAFGQPIVNFMLQKLPDWLMGGLRVAGGILPVVGIAILLRYLPTGRFIAWLIIGFAVSAWLKTPVIFIAVIGLACAIIHYRNTQSRPAPLTPVRSSAGDENVDGEYED